MLLLASAQCSKCIDILARMDILYQSSKKLKHDNVQILLPESDHREEKDGHAVLAFGQFCTKF